MEWLWITLIVLFSALLLFFAITFYFFLIVFRRGCSLPAFLTKRLESPFWAKHRSEIEEGKRWVKAQEMESVTIKSRDGLTLHAKYFPAEVPSRRTVLLFHGYRSSRNDFSCIVPVYHDFGLNILLVDQRTHGESEGKFVTLGILERFDCIDWIDYINSRDDRPDDIFLGGVSMGTSTVLMAAGLGLPENVRGITADCGFTTPNDILIKIMKKNLKIPKFPMLQIMNFICKAFAGFDMKASSAISAVKKNTVPILFIHSYDDDFVPYEMSVEMQKASLAPSRLISVSGAPHGASYLQKPEFCKQCLLSFFNDPEGTAKAVSPEDRDR